MLPTFAFRKVGVAKQVCLTNQNLLPPPLHYGNGPLLNTLWGVMEAPCLTVLLHMSTLLYRTTAYTAMPPVKKP